MLKISLLGMLLSLLSSPFQARAAAPENATPPTPLPLPAIQGLELEPAKLSLQDGRDERRVLVWGKVEGDKRVDLTSQATFHCNATNLEVGAKGYLRARAAGTVEVIVKAGGQETKLPVAIESAELPKVRFVRDIEPIMSKVGCNAGTCHGSAKGKNGFKLSLRGYDPAFDYQALINDISGRRFDRVAVDESLMLLKPTGEVPHEGRQVITRGSREYALLRQWIADGAEYEAPDTARAKRIEVLPRQIEMDLPGRQQQMLVLAHYADGSVRDVTREAVFTSNNEDVGKISDGLVSSLRRGEAAILTRYEGLYEATLLTVMGDRSGYEWAEVPEYNYIDKHVHSKLRQMKILPSELCTDAEFVRRVFLDLTGVPPKAERVKGFLNDATPSKEKREKLVDELLQSADYVERWANKWADLLQCNSETLGPKAVFVFRQWISRSIAADMPYDEFVRTLLTAEGSSYRNPEVNYLRALREPGKITEDVSQTFLGIRFNCNKCHDHPFERWTQDQYYQFGASFARVAMKRGSTPGEEVVYRNYRGGEVKHPRNDMDVAPKVPFGADQAIPPSSHRREAFVEWLTSKENPWFAKSLVNRVWSYFYGRGIIEPVDDIRASNPPSNPELLEALTQEFIASGFNTRKLMRSICTSHTYQLSIKHNKWNNDDTVNFSHAMPRRLSAEQLLDALAVATGVRPKFNGLPAGMRADEIPDGNVAGDDFLALFGRPKRQSACECERTSNITLSHALNMINGDTVSEAVNSPSSRVAKLVEKEKDDRKVVEDIYYSCLGRPPTEAELGMFDLSAEGKRLEVAQDLAWALLNSPAFLFNR